MIKETVVQVSNVAQGSLENFLNQESCSLFNFIACKSYSGEKLTFCNNNKAMETGGLYLPEIKKLKLWGI